MKYNINDKVWVKVGNNHTILNPGSILPAIIIGLGDSEFARRIKNKCKEPCYEIDIEGHPHPKNRDWVSAESRLYPRNDYDGNKIDSWDNCPFIPKSLTVETN